ncbi:hypothetical protein MRB53_038152 [Persea americana]|nr:hypothetical protein MRB53_038152 [Persea americana]
MGGHVDAGCVPASERLGPFGHSSRAADVEGRPWDTLNWGGCRAIVPECIMKRRSPTTDKRRLQPPAHDLDELLSSPRLDGKRTGRSAVVLRTWDQYDYYENQKAWMRAHRDRVGVGYRRRVPAFHSC